MELYSAAGDASPLAAKTWREILGRVCTYAPAFYIWRRSPPRANLRSVLLSVKGVAVLRPQGSSAQSGQKYLQNVATSRHKLSTRITKDHYSVHLTRMDAFLPFSLPQGLNGAQTSHLQSPQELQQCDLLCCSVSSRPACAAYLPNSSTAHAGQAGSTVREPTRNRLRSRGLRAKIMEPSRLDRSQEGCL